MLGYALEINGVNVQYFCNKFVLEEEDREDESWRMQPILGKGELRVNE